MHLEIDLLRTFTVIAETRTLSQAASRVGRTQAAVSMQLKRLEDAVGHTLCKRTGRGVLLTAQGERLLVHAHKLLHYHDDAMAELSGKGLSGTIRFGCPDDYAAVFLPHLLRGFARQHPQVMVEVVCGSTPRLVDRLQARSIDLALVSLAEGEDDAIVIRHEPLVWVGYLGGNAMNQVPLQLALSDLDTLDHRAAKEALERTGKAYRIAYASSSLAGLTAVVRSGQALAVLTQTAVPPDLHILPPDSGLPPLPSVGLAVKLAGAQPSALVEAFSRHIHAVLPGI